MFESHVFFYQMMNSLTFSQRYEIFSGSSPWLSHRARKRETQEEESQWISKLPWRQTSQLEQRSGEPQPRPKKPRPPEFLPGPQETQVTGGGATPVGLLLWKHCLLELLFCIFSAIHREEPGRKRPADTGTFLHRASNTSHHCSIKLCKVAQPVPNWLKCIDTGDSLHCWLISKSFPRSVDPVTKVTTNHSTPTPPTEDDRGHLKMMILTLNSFLLRIWALISELWLECKNPTLFISS